MHSRRNTPSTTQVPATFACARRATPCRQARQAGGSSANGNSAAFGSRMCRTQRCRTSQTSWVSVLRLNRGRDAGGPVGGAAMAEQAPLPELLQYCSSSSDSDADSQDRPGSVGRGCMVHAVRSKRGRSPSVAAAAPGPKRAAAASCVLSAAEDGTASAPQHGAGKVCAPTAQVAAGVAAPALPARARAYEHVAGNWPTVVWLDCGSAEPKVRQAWTRIVETQHTEDGAQGAAAGAGAVLRHDPDEPAALPLSSPAADGGGGWTAVWDGGTSLPLHVTLTRPFALQQYQIAPFVLALRTALSGARAVAPAGCSRSAPLLRHFTAELGSEPVVLPSSTGAREFLTLPLLGRGRAAAVACVRAVDEVVQAFDGPPFFADPKPHVSVAWRLRAFGEGEPSRSRAAARGTEVALPDDGDGSASEDSDDDCAAVIARVRVREVLVRCGDRRFSVPIGAPSLGVSQ